MIAPRKLQSLAAIVHAVAAAVSSVRSTSNVVANAGIRLEIAGAVRATVNGWLDELEDAFWLKFINDQTNTTRVKTDQVTFLFIVTLQPNLARRSPGLCKHQPQRNRW